MLTNFGKNCYFFIAILQVIYIFLCTALYRDECGNFVYLFFMYSYSRFLRKMFLWINQNAKCKIIDTKNYVEYLSTKRLILLLFSAYI